MSESIHVISSWTQIGRFGFSDREIGVSNSAERRFTEITEITTEITSNIILLGPVYGCFSNIKFPTVDITY